MNLNEYGFGFQILARKQRLKLDLDAHGIAGLRSLISACIASGITHHCDIIEEIADITGEHTADIVVELLGAGDGIDWHQWPDDTYTSLSGNQCEHGMTGDARPLRELI